MGRKTDAFFIPVVRHGAWTNRTNGRARCGRSWWLTRGGMVVHRASAWMTTETTCTSSSGAVARMTVPLETTASTPPWRCCATSPRENMHIHENVPATNPTSPAAIMDLPQCTMEEAGTTRECTGCAVCHEEFEEAERLTKLPCGHLFHRECIMPWLEVQNTCPTCRHKLPRAQKGSGKQTVQIGQRGNASGGLEAAVAADEEETSVLGDFFGASGEVAS